MKAIVTGCGVGLLALAALVWVESRASADECVEVCSEGFAAFSGLQSNLVVDGSRYFSATGTLQWCAPNFEPTAGAVEVVEGQSSNVYDVITSPYFINPSGCYGTFNVYVDGYLDAGESTGTLTVHGFVYQPPYYGDQHTFSIYE